MLLIEKLISIMRSIMNKKLRVIFNPVENIYYFATKCEIFLMLISTLCACATGLLVPWNILMFGELVGSMVKAELMNSFQLGTVDESDIMESVTTFAIGTCIIGCIMFILAYINIYLYNYIAQNQVFRVRKKFFKSILHQDISWYDLMNSSEISTRLTEDMMKFEDGIGEKWVMFLHNTFAVLGCLAVAFHSGWKLALICISPFPVMILIMYKTAKTASNSAKEEMKVYGAAGSIAEEALSAIRTVFAFGGENNEYNEYTKNLSEVYKHNKKRALLIAIGTSLFWFFIYATYSVSFWNGVNLVLDERFLPPEIQTYTPKSMATIFFSIMMATVNIHIAANFVDAFAISRAAALKIFSVIKRKSSIDSSSPEGIKPQDFQGEIQFKNVAFTYPSRPLVQVLENLSFTVNKGETVAIVGQSGCGKSTCIQLIQRFYDPIEGQILIDGYDIRKLNIKWARNQLGIVGQEPTLFDTTIAENIRFGLTKANMEQIISAAKEANAHDFIMKLPNQYNTLVGEKGTKISGGQKQRIAIARALIRDPKILLLDEATSALDNRSEAKVQAALNKAKKGRTTIIVAHRLSTIRNADKIIVLSNGQVTEEGDHDFLMKLQGHYYSLVTSQVSNVPESLKGESKRSHSKHHEKERGDDESSSSSEISYEDLELVQSKEVSSVKILKLSKQEWPYLIAACLFSIVVGCSPPVFSILFGDVIGELSIPDTEEVLRRTSVYCKYFIVAGITIAISNFIQIYCFGIAAECLTMRLRGLIFKTMLRQEIGWFDCPSNGTGALCSKLSTDAAAVQGATGQRMGTIIQSTSTIILSVVLSIYYEWRLGLVGTLFVPLILVTTYLQNLMYRKQSSNHHSDLETSTKMAVEAVSNIRTVVGLGLEETCHSYYIKALESSVKLAKKNSKFRGLVFALARSVVYFAYATCMYYGGILINEEHLSYSSVFKVSQALIIGTVMVANASAFAPNFQRGIQAAENIIALFEREPKIQDPLYISKNEESPNDSVKYKKVCFEYPTRPGIRILDDLCLEVPSGKTVAIIGGSGCGKSTIVQLLERFYDPILGSVELDNTSIDAMPQSSLRMHFGLVSQEPTLFARSIAENIAYGDNTRDISMWEIITASKKANAHDFISSLPLGYETKLGDKGTQLSGGQKQRIAIARALIRDPKILLLDEATSALDSESEKIIQSALDKTKQGRTCILIAHRLSTVENADKICVLHYGQVVECGTHKELIEQKGMYYDLLCLEKGRR